MNQPVDDLQVTKVLSVALSLGMEGAALKGELQRRGITINYVVNGIDASFILDSEGFEIGSSKSSPLNPVGLVSIFADRRTSHQFLSREISFSSALASGGMRVTGSKEKLSWLLAYLEPIHQGYAVALREAP